MPPVLAALTQIVNASKSATCRNFSTAANRPAARRPRRALAVAALRRAIVRRVTRPTLASRRARPRVHLPVPPASQALAMRIMNVARKIPSVRVKIKARDRATISYWAVSSKSSIASPARFALNRKQRPGAARALAAARSATPTQRASTARIALAPNATAIAHTAPRLTTLGRRPATPPVLAPRPAIVVTGSVPCIAALRRTVPRRKTAPKHMTAVRSTLIARHGVALGTSRCSTAAPANRRRQSAIRSLPWMPSLPK